MAIAKAPKKPWIAALLALVLGGPGCFYLGWRRGVVATLGWMLALPLPRVGVVSELALGQDGNLEFAIMFLFLVHAGLAWLAFRSCKRVNTEAAKKAESPESEPYRAIPEIPNKKKKRALILSAPTERRKRQFFADFDRVAFAPAAALPPVSRSAGKLLKGATLVHTLVPLVFLLPERIGANIFSLTLMWYASVRIAQAWFFRDAGVLERTRWKRFWIGDVVSSVIVSSWMMGAFLFGDMPPLLRQRLTTSFSRSPWTFVIDLSAIIYLVGLLGGFYNVKRWDKRDKEEILDWFQEWRLRQSGQAS